jgi:hypothetical protein
MARIFGQPMGALVKIETELEGGETVEVHLSSQHCDHLHLEIGKRVGLVARRLKVLRSG